MKKFFIPLQALAAMFLCASMAWLVLIVAGTDPTPPSALDLQARNTQDVSFASMNSTAIALAGQMAGDWLPSPVAPFSLPVTGADTPTVMPFVTLKALPTLPAAPTTWLPGLPSPTAAGGRPGRSVPVSTPSRAPAPTAGSTLRPTITPSPVLPGVPTSTLQVPTLTTASTPLSTKLPSSTPTRLPTMTPGSTENPSSTPVAPPTSVPPPTDTPMPVSTPADTSIPNATNTPKPSNTPKPENTHKPNPSDTPVPPATEPPTP